LLSFEEEERREILRAFIRRWWGRRRVLEVRFDVPCVLREPQREYSRFLKR